MKSKILSGQCFCGFVKYELLDSPMFVNCCHCTDCQSQTGSAFVINAVIETFNLKIITGKMKKISMPTSSGRSHDIFRCPKCLTAIWSDYGKRPIRFVRVSTINSPHKIKPNAHIFTRSKLSWVKLQKTIPSFKVFYDIEKQWSKKSLQRRKKSFGLNS